MGTASGWGKGSQEVFFSGRRRYVGSSPIPFERQLIALPRPPSALPSLHGWFYCCCKWGNRMSPTAECEKVSFGRAPKRSRSTTYISKRTSGTLFALEKLTGCAAKDVSNEAPYISTARRIGRSHNKLFASLCGTLAHLRQREGCWHQ